MGSKSQWIQSRLPRSRGFTVALHAFSILGRVFAPARCPVAVGSMEKGLLSRGTLDGLASPDLHGRLLNSASNENANAQGAPRLEADRSLR